MSNEQPIANAPTFSAGLPVVYCLPGSSAYRSGVRRGDIIVEVNGVTITDACSYLRACRLDEGGMSVTVRRGESLLALCIPLAQDVPSYNKVNVVERFVC